MDGRKVAVCHSRFIASSFVARNARDSTLHDTIIHNTCLDGYATGLQAKQLQSSHAATLSIGDAEALSIKLVFSSALQSMVLRCDVVLDASITFMNLSNSKLAERDAIVGRWAWNAHLSQLIANLPDMPDKMKWQRMTVGERLVRVCSEQRPRRAARG